MRKTKAEFEIWRLCEAIVSYLTRPKAGDASPSIKIEPEDLRCAARIP